MIPIYKPYFNSNNLKYAHNAIDSGWVSSQGEYLTMSLELLKDRFKYGKIILTNNGTSATHLVAKAIKFKHPNINKIIVPNNVYVAAWNSFIYDKDYLLIPVDCDLETWNIDENKIENIIDENTAILIVHNIGNVINVPKLKRKYPNTLFVEDNCEGFLGKYENRFTGTDSFASSLSFFGNKTLTSGEGGAFITNDDDVFDFINTTKNQGQSDFKFLHSCIGYNYRMTNVQAAILYGQILDLDIIVEKKNQVFENYFLELNDVEEISFQKIEENTQRSNWMFGIRFKSFDISLKRELELFLFNSGIDTRPMFYEINKHSHLSNIVCEVENAKILQYQCIILPSFPDLKKHQISFICNKIKSFLKNKKILKK